MKKLNDHLIKEPLKYNMRENIYIIILFILKTKCLAKKKSRDCIKKNYALHIFF